MCLSSSKFGDRDPNIFGEPRYFNFFNFLYYLLCVFNVKFFFLQNELIQGDIYSCLWYDMRPTDCKSLWIIMIRSQRPITITAGKFIHMTLDSYTKVIV